MVDRQKVRTSVSTTYFLLYYCGRNRGSRKTLRVGVGQPSLTSDRVDSLETCIGTPCFSTQKSVLIRGTLKLKTRIIFPRH